VAHSPPRRPRTRLDRWIERRINAASLPILERYARLLAPKPKLERVPGWTWADPHYRDDLGTFTRRLIWKRYHDEQIARPVAVAWCRGLRLRLRLGNDIGWSVFIGGAYEPNELVFLAATLQPGMTFVDVGANEGLYTLLAAVQVGNGGRVFALEPSSREVERLRANIDVNRLRNVEVFQLALYDRAGSAPLTRASFGHEGQNVIGNRIPNAAVATAGAETVRLETLDAFVAARSLDRLDLVKLDAEGCEARIVEGGRSTMQRFRPILLIEIAPEHLAAQGSSVDHLLELLAELDYRVSVFGGDGLPHSRVGDEPLSDNIVAIWQPTPVKR
jgi:FkbM family methyltransferase